MHARATTVMGTLLAAWTTVVSAAPNVVIIYADDLGYGDLACYGHPTIRTPHLDRMAAEGMRFTEFYSAAEVCTPSRAALLTGRYPIRSGMCHDTHRVLRRNSAGGLPVGEHTLAETLRAAGYATACVGKWHLGHLPRHLPAAHGFDRFFGMPFSNDMQPAPDAPRDRTRRFFGERTEFWRTPLIRGTDVVEEAPDQHFLTPRYTAEAVDFITAHRDRPFFLYMAHSFPHVPLFASPDFVGRSRAGRYGDVVEEIDWSVGRILDTLRDLGLDGRTLVVFSSDNGPWTIFDQHGGSAGMLRGGKGSTWEGGMRVPGIAWWPGTIPASTIQHEMATTLDVVPTCVALAGGTIPAGTELDGVDIRDLLLDAGPVERPPFVYYRGTRPFAIRSGRWKMHRLTQAGYGQAQPEPHDPPLLFDLGVDPAERFDVAADHPDVVRDLSAALAAHEAAVVPAETQLEATVADAAP